MPAVTRPMSLATVHRAPITSQSSFTSTYLSLGAHNNSTIRKVRVCPRTSLPGWLADSSVGQVGRAERWSSKARAALCEHPTRAPNKAPNWNHLYLYLSRLLACKGRPLQTTTSNALQTDGRSDLPARWQTNSEGQLPARAILLPSSSTTIGAEIGGVGSTLSALLHLSSYTYSFISQF